MATFHNLRTNELYVIPQIIFNDICVDQIYNFIFEPFRSHSLSEIGTGGTPFMIYLKSIRDCTLAAKIEADQEQIFSPVDTPENVWHEKMQKANRNSL